MTDQYTDIFRLTYGILGFLCSAGFTASLKMRWHVLTHGERILRFFLILFFLVLIYGAYVAYTNNYPPSEVGLLLSICLAGVVFGFGVWFWEDLWRGNRTVHRVTRGDTHA